MQGTQAGSPTLLARIARLEDIEAIRALTARYCRASDKQRDTGFVEAIADCFTADGVWHGGALGRYEGMEGFQRLWAGSGSLDSALAIHTTSTELSALDPALLGAVQLCDGPAEMAPDLQLFHEGFLQRMIPGEGDFALADFVRALPPARLIGVEVPLQDLADLGVPVEERARRAVAGARCILGENGYDA